MKSPIARGLRAASRLVEWGHRRIHGPKYAPGDVVETVHHGDKRVAKLEHKAPSESGNVWVVKRMTYGEAWRLHEAEISRVVRYARGE